MNLNGQKAGEDIYRKFWDLKAKKYPSPFDPKVTEVAQKIIALVTKKGVKIKNTNILDIGCGTGIYTLPLARQASRVTALDFSRGMLARLQEAAGQNGGANVETVLASWKDVDLARLGWERTFDVVWAAMTMAVRDREELAKMERASKDWCVYIGWGGMRKNIIMEEAFARHGLKFGPPPGAAKISRILAELGRIPSQEFFTDTWVWQGSLEEAIEDIAAFIEVGGARPDREMIADVLLPYLVENTITHHTYVEEAIFVWQVS